MAAPAPAPSTRKLVGFDNFVRNNPLSDKFEILRFHHLEIYCGDATNASKRFSWGLGMNEVGKSDLSTGNKDYASYVVKTNDFTLIFTSPYNSGADRTDSFKPNPNFDSEVANKFIRDHGLAVRAIGISVGDAEKAFEVSVASGATPISAPQKLTDKATGTVQTISEVKWQDDVIVRWVSGNFTGPALANYEITPCPDVSIGIRRLDHAVTNVPNLFNTVDYLCDITGFHQFSEFTAEDVGTVDSGLNSMVLANNNKYVLLPINEPTFGTKRKSQIQTFLEANNGAGVQHLALLTNDIFATVAEMRARTRLGGFDFMPAPGPEYYAKVPSRIGADTLSAAQLAELQRLGLLADKDDQGVLLQVFTRPVGDRPTLFVEIIQRIGCDKSDDGAAKEQTAGCGGFGKGNFTELFKSIEDFEKLQEANALKNKAL